MLRNFCKDIVTRVGANLSRDRLLQIQTFANHLHMGAWMKEHHFAFHERKRNRIEVWEEMISRIAGRQVLYLEFGVAAGEATRWWSKQLRNPADVLHGFDSFEGLPENVGPWYKGQFDASGKMPLIDDKRVNFFKGWFDQVLPTYTPPSHDLLVLNMDADLYSSTAYVLKWARPLIRAGTLIYFDEMDHVDHEPRAFHEFMEESGLHFRPLAADLTLSHVAFECIG